MLARPGPVIWAPANCYFNVGLSSKLYSVNTREIAWGYISIISGAKHDFLYQLFALIPNFSSRGPYLPGNDSFIKSSSKIHETENLTSPDSSEQKRKNRCLLHLFFDF